MWTLKLLLWTVLLTGCTEVCVKQIDPMTPFADGPVGQRFALPVPAFVVTPTGDGGVKLDRQDLPDPANTFAIDGWSVLAQHKLNVEVKNGILAEIRWAPDSSAVLGQAVSATGDVMSEAVKAQRTTEKSDTDSVRSAELDVAQARAEYEATKKAFGADSDEAKKAKIELEKAERKLAVLRRQTGLADVSNDPTLRALYNDPTKTDQIKAFDTAPGPAIFVLVVDEKTGRPRLVPSKDEGGQQQVRVPIAGTKPPAAHRRPARP